MNAIQLERDLEDTKRRARNMLDRVTATAEAEGRAMTTAERQSVQTLLDEGKAIKARIDRARGDDSMLAEIERLTGGLHVPGSIGTDNGRAFTGRSIGAQFVANDAYRQFIRDGGHRRAGGWASPFVEAAGFHEMRAATLTTGSASGGALTQPDVRPGVVVLPTAPVVVADLPLPGTTNSGVVEFMKEKTFTNAAAAVAEGGTKPESSLVFERATNKVEKVAHWLPVTEEMLEDYDQTRSVIDGRLRSGLTLEEDAQLLNGDGVSPNLLGFMSLTGLSAAVARGADTNADAIAKQIAAISIATFLMPDAVVMNPINWLAVQLAKDANGQYISGSSPLEAPGPRTIWGLPAAVTPSIVANTALVGCFRSSSQIFRKGGVRVEASNSHSDFFVKNLVAVRAEERLVLAVYREAAFGKVTGLA